MPEAVSDRMATPTGIPQGSPLSPILYLIYNACLIEADDNDERENGTTALGWVDDVAIVAAGRTEQETVNKLSQACEKAQEWATKHASVFAPAKFKLIHFVNPNAPDTQPEFTPIPLRDVTIEATRTAERYLGFWLDPALTFSEHRKNMVAKAGKSLVALRGLSGSTWGTSLLAMRKVYQAVVIPQMLYGVAAWFQPGIMSAKESNNIVRQFASVQKRAAVIMGGAFRTTAMAALNVELCLPPMKVQMERMVRETAVRIRTGPAHGLGGILNGRREDERTLGGWTLMEVQARKRDVCLLAPPGSLAGDRKSVV